MTTQLPSWHNLDGRSRVMPVGITGVLNARLDSNHIQKCQRRVATGSGDIKYRGTALTGALADKAHAIFDWEPVFVEKAAAYEGSNGRFGRAVGTASRNVGSIEQGVPVFASFVGEAGSTPGEIENRAEFVGIAQYTGNGDGDGRATLFSGGMYTACNTGPETWAAGDYLMWGLPQNDAEHDQIRAWTGNMANVLGKNGRVPAVIRPFRYESVDFFNPDTVRKAIDDAYETVQITAAGGDNANNKTYRKRDKLKDNLDSSSIRGQMAHAVSHIVESQTKIVACYSVLIAQPAGIIAVDTAVQAATAAAAAAAAAAAIDAAAIREAIRVHRIDNIAGGQGGNGKKTSDAAINAPTVAADADNAALIAPGELKAAMDRIRSFVIHTLLASLTRPPADYESLADGPAGLGDDGTRNALRTALFQDRPYEQMVRGMAAVKQRVERRIIGRAVHGAPVGKDADVHLRAYAH